MRLVLSVSTEEAGSEAVRVVGMLLAISRADAKEQQDGAARASSSTAAQEAMVSCGAAAVMALHIAAASNAYPAAQIHWRPFVLTHTAQTQRVQERQASTSERQLGSTETTGRSCRRSVDANARSLTVVGRPHV